MNYIYLIVHVFQIEKYFIFITYDFIYDLGLMVYNMLLYSSEVQIKAFSLIYL